MAPSSDDLGELLRRKDPWGYYIVPAKRDALRELPSNLLEALDVEDVGDIILLRTRSRALARKIAGILLRKRLLAQ